MKLLLPRRLYSALCASVLSTSTLVTTAVVAANLAPLTQATDMTYIYTGNGGNITTAGSLGYGASAENWTTYTYVRNHWLEGSSASRNNVIRFVSAEEYTRLSGDDIGSGTSIGIDAGKMNLGGLIVDTGATGYSYVAPSSGSDRNIFIQGNVSSDSTSAAVFTINEDFTFRNASTSSSAIARDFSLAADANVTVATGKTFTVSGNWAAGAGKTLSLSGGGTMLYTDTGATTATAAAFDWDISGASILRLNGSNISSGNAVLGSGMVSLSGASTLAVDVADSDLTGNFTVGVGGATLTGTGTTLNGTLTYTDYTTDLLALNGSFILGDLTLDLGLESVANGDYTIMTRAADSTTFDTSTGGLTILGLEGLKNTSLGWDGNNLVLSIADFEGSQLSWTGGSSTWSTDATSTAWDGAAYRQGDIVSFSNDIAGTDNVITLVGELAPSGDITVDGEGNTVFFAATPGTDMITGTASLVKDGTGELVLLSENSYTGGTTLNAGTLTITNMNALGAGDLEINGGTLIVFGVPGVEDVALAGDRITLADGVSFNLNLDNVNATLSNGIADHALDLSGSGTLTASWDKVTSVHVTAGATALFNAQDTDANVYKTISGDGDISYNGGGTYSNFAVKFSADEAFTGTLAIQTGKKGAMDITNSSATGRMALDLQGSSELAIASANNGDTLYLKELKGDGILRYDYNLSGDTVKNVDLVMSESMEFGGTILYNAARTGTFTVSSDSLDTTLTLSGAGMTGSVDSETKAQLNINTAKVKLSEGAQWNGRINLDDGVVEFANTTAVTRDGSKGQITGTGTVLINSAEVVTFEKANAYSGITQVNADATLKLAHNEAAGTSKISTAGGASLVLADGVTISNNLTVTGTLTLSSEGTSTLTGNFVTTVLGRSEDSSKGIDISSGIVNIDGDQDLSSYGITVRDGATLNLQNATINYNTLTVEGLGTLNMQSSTLTSLAVTDTGEHSFTTSEGGTSLSRVYTIDGLTAATFSSVVDGSTLTLDLGIQGEFDELSITALHLVGISSIGSLYYDEVIFKINGVDYAARGMIAPGGASGTDLFLYIPEPSTATLSLMALAGLLARRRRKTA